MTDIRPACANLHLSFQQNQVESLLTGSGQGASLGSMATSGSHPVAQLARAQASPPSGASSATTDAYNHFVDNIRRKVLAQAQSGFHSPSKTHIFYVTWLGSFGIRGVGVFPNEAFKDLQEKVDKLLYRASEQDLVQWDELARTEEQKSAREKVIKETSSSLTSSQVSMYTSEGLRTALQAISGSDRTSTEARELLVKALDALEHVIDSRGREAALAIVSQAASEANSFYGGLPVTKWTLTLPRDLKARLAICSRELDMNISNLCRSLLAQALASRSTY